MLPKYIPLLLILCLSGCRKDEKSILEGKWNLVLASGTIIGITKEYPKGDITWTFDSKLKIVNNYNGAPNFSQPSGTYSFTLEENKLGQELSINDQYFANISRLTSDSLILDQNQISDGVSYIFVR